MPDTKHVFAFGNITRVVHLDFTNEDILDAQGNFVDENGFFIRSAIDGTIKYCPVGNTTDAEAITKPIAASDIFVDPELCRKVFNLGTTPDTDIYIGYGV